MIGKLIPYAIMAAVAALALWRDAPYATIPFLCAMLAWYTTRMLLTDASPKEVVQERDAKRERSLAAAVGIGIVVIPLITLATPILDFAAYKVFPGQLFIGGVVALVGVYVFWRSHADLGSMWSAHLELREGHTLVTKGIYSRIRHPMYTAIFLITIAQAFLLTNLIAGPAGLFAFALLYITRIDPEEQMMADQFGKEWDAYAARAPRLMPRFAFS